MKQKSFYSLLLVSVMTLTAILSSGCTEDEPEMFTTQRIVINYTDSVTDASISPGSRTRSVPECTKIGSSILTSKSGKKLYLSCTETVWPSDKTAKTRGTKVTTAGLSNLGVSASVYPAANSYTSAGCGSYFYKESVSSGTPMSYYWPTADYRISFFGYYPYNNPSFTVQSAASATGAPTYAYTVPSAIASQQDIMTGQVTDLPGGSSSPVNMTLAHRCSAIHFSITNDRSDAITVNSISIEGVKYTGTLSGSTWMLGGSVNSSSTNPFTLTYGSSVAAGATVDITGTSNIFMMLPQTLPSGAKLKVVVDDEEFETDLTGTWVAGKEYTYTISMSEDAAIDLSMVDNAGNERLSMTTANCYLVHAAGKYKIPLVYGNAIKDGTDNRIAYFPGENGSIANGTDQFENHAGYNIAGPWITKSTSGTGVNKGMGLTAASAELLWQDASGLISAVGVDGDYLTFTVGTYTGGNALIAAKDGSGTILWSWHIWATTETLTNLTSINTGSHTDLSGASASYRVAPVNLGWIATGGSGKQGYCPYYQWGRKDPFIPCNGTTNGNVNKTVYNISGTSIIGLTHQVSTTVTIAENIKNPTCFYYNRSTVGPVTTTYCNMWDAQNTAKKNVTTATKKTIYDPCPPGFCVPTGNLWYYFVNGGSVTISTFDSTNKGITCSALWFPAVGIRGPNTLSYVGSSGYCWSATPYDDIYSASSLMYGTASCSWGSLDRFNGISVRPVVEE